ncbi:unnamed protein product [Camellia sinensis]
MPHIYARTQIATTMLPRWSRAVTYLSRVSSHKNNMVTRRDFHGFSCQSYSKVAAATATEVPIAVDSAEKGYVSTPEESYCQPGKPKQITWLMCAEYQSTLFQQVNLNKMFWSKPCSLALAPDSPLKVEEPKYEGIRYIFLKLMLFYSKQSKSIRGANVVYRRIISQVDKPAIYDVFSLEKTFKTTFSLLVLHMWLCLHRLKQEADEGVEFGQYLYEIYNHDVELRVSRAGVNLLLTRWMKDLEKIFYGNVVAYDAALLPEAKQHELENVLWRNVFSDDGSSIPNDAGQRAVQVSESSIYWASCTSYVKICSQGVFLLLLNSIKKLCFLATSCSLHWRTPQLMTLRGSIEEVETRFGNIYVVIREMTMAHMIHPLDRVSNILHKTLNYEGTFSN